MSDDLNRARVPGTGITRQHQGHEPEKPIGDAMAKWSGGVTPVPDDADGNALCWKCHESPPNNGVPGALCHPCWELRIGRRTREASDTHAREHKAWLYFRDAYRKAGKIADPEGRQRDRDELERRFLKAMPHYTGLLRRWVLEGYGDRDPNAKGDKLGRGWS